MKNYKTKKNEVEYNSIINELQLAPSRVYDIPVPYFAVGDCPSCPECLCADFLGEDFTTVAGIAFSTPVLLACKVAFAAP